ncbi:MAG: N-acetyltransferase [Clostridiales bacterium]|nr:N-acetyltransferase [Clostridiales bacterium]
MNSILVNQLAIDFCCGREDVESRENVYTVYSPQPGRRIFKEGENFLKAAAVNGKLLFSGRPQIIEWAKERYGNESGAWFMEYRNLRELDDKMKDFGCRIGQAHPFFIATEKTRVDTGDLLIVKYTGDELEQFRGDGRFDEAFLFEELPKDEIGIAAWKDGKLLGMAGATSDSDQMWQIGINVMPEAERKGIGSMLVALLKNEILDLGRLPFYGTAMSHIASQRVAVRAGFYPAWAELNCERL